jgi:cation:H+ antiporter
MGQVRPLAVVIISGMVLIVLSADYFTNGVEWLGQSLGLKANAVGTLLAAMGTALPETLVPLVAVLAGNQTAGVAVGIGAILGAPFMLSTLGFFVLGAGTWWSRRGRPVAAEVRPAAARDLRFFLGAMAAALVTGFLPAPAKPWVGGALVAAYLVFAGQVLVAGRGGDDAEPSAPLHLWHAARPPLAVVLGQVAMALMGLVIGAHYFVDALIGLAASSGISGFLLSVLLTPVATELPEVLNSVIWLRRGRDPLAFGNVTGAMAFQASVVPAMGMWLTAWRLSPPELVVGGVTLAATLWVLWRLRHRVAVGSLMLAGVGYAGLVGAFWTWAR